MKTLLDYGAATANTWYNIAGLNIKKPAGDFMLSGFGPIQSSSASAAYKAAQININTTAASLVGAEDAWGFGPGIPANDSGGTFTILPTRRSTTTMTTYYINLLSTVAATDLFIMGDRGTFRILFENAHI